MIRLSPSLLESYRLFRTEEWFTPEKMREDITKKFVPSSQILLGRAYHGMLENFTSLHEMYFCHGAPADNEMLATWDNHTFAYEPCVAPVADFLKARAVHEVYGVKTFHTANGEVSIATKADAVWGNIGGEWKTTEKAIQIMKYADSVQWKTCAWVLGLKAIDYRVLRLEQREDGVWTCAESDDLQCVWSDSLIPEIVDLADGLIDFHRQHGLEEYLKPYHARKVA